MPLGVLFYRHEALPAKYIIRNLGIRVFIAYCCQHMACFGFNRSHPRPEETSVAKFYRVRIDPLLPTFQNLPC